MLPQILCGVKGERGSPGRVVSVYPAAAELPGRNLG